MFNCAQFKQYILTTALSALQMDSPQAQMLMLGTVATESQGGTYLAQEGGPALGIYEMEQPTHDDIWDWLGLHPIVRHRLLKVGNLSGKHDASVMISNLLYATAMARLLYYRIGAPIPDDLPSVAAYYKKYYNTERGSNTTEKFIIDYNNFVGGVYGQSKSEVGTRD